MNPRIVVTKLARGVYEVRLHDGDAIHYFASFNITVHQFGRLLKASMLNVRKNAPIFLGEQWWRWFAAQYFPRAHWATYSRMTKRGEVWREPIALTHKRVSFKQSLNDTMLIICIMAYRAIPPRMAPIN